MTYFYEYIIFLNNYSKFLSQYLPKTGEHNINISYRITLSNITCLILINNC